MRLLELTVKNVRGLLDLHLQLDGKSVVIWGPNGSGKSSVVDAIDFLFTGRISSLMGEGTAGITLARHGPHIDHVPGSAVVTAKVQLEGLAEPIELTRCMAQPDKLICPDEARESLAKVRGLMSGGGVVLTRRDILRYVAAEAGKRADEIQEILHLKNIDTVRSSLVSARTELGRKQRAAQAAIETARAEVNVTLGLTKYSDEGLLEQVNESRHTLGGGRLDVPVSSGFKEGIALPSSSETGHSSVNPNLFQQTVENIRQRSQSSIVQGLAENDETLRRDITKLKTNPELFAALDRLELTEHAARFVEDSTVECPVCGMSWPEGHLKTHLEARIAIAHDAQSVRTEILESAAALAVPTRDLLANVNGLKEGLAAAAVETGDEDLQVIDSWLESLNYLLSSLVIPVEQYLDSGLSADAIARLFVPEALNDLLDRVEKTVQESMPKPTPEQTAWDKLTRLEESVRALENRTREKEISSRHFERSKILVAEYEKARDLVLEGLYSRIANRFVEFYHVLHDHEGDLFDARLQPQGASLTFEVDFMGRGTHPPHALHSEGHQDSMGVCLFLALNEELAKGELNLIVLDDVVMSVDTGHRKDVCRLINEQFSDTQFVITTHDKTWAKQLRYEGVVNRNQVIELTGWTVEGGPRSHRQVDLWEAIRADLEQDNVHGAAFKLRRGGEDFFESVCDALGAEVTYNSGTQWQLDDWLPAAMEKYKSLLRIRRNSAVSWGDKPTIDELSELESVRRQVYGRIHVEQWAINTSVHFNNWENMSQQDFSPVVEAFSDLRALFVCSNCRGLLEKIPRKGSPQSVKCPCGKVNWNLRHKPSNG